MNRFMISMDVYTLQRILKEQFDPARFQEGRNDTRICLADNNPADMLLETVKKGLNSADYQPSYWIGCLAELQGDKEWQVD